MAPPQAAQRMGEHGKLAVMMPAIFNGTARMSRRWLAFLLLAALLHLLAINWATGVIGLPDWRSPQVLSVQLVPDPPAPPKPAPAPPPKPRPAPVPKKAGAEPKRAQPAPAEPVRQEPTAEVAAAEAPASQAASAPAEAGASPGANANPAPSAPPEAGTPEQRPYTVQPPPSVELAYSVNATRGEQAIHGNGKIAWHARGTSYEINGEASVMFFSVLTFKSEGTLESQGVAPILYSEKRFRKSSTNTHFHRERKTISFSASTASYPRLGTEQDRASIIWQLASIGRGDPAQFYPGAVFEIMVAGTRDAEPWQLRVVGEETIAGRAGQIQAWHVVRRPRPGSYQQGIDIWLVPGQDWYPLKLRYTDPNGDYLEMSADTITRLD